MADPTTTKVAGKVPAPPSDAELLRGPQPGGGAETMVQVVDKATEDAEVHQTAAEAAADAAAQLVKLAALPPVPLNLPLEDALGRKLPKDDPAEARRMQREATIVRQQRVEVDVKRVERGLEPLYADK